MDKGNKVYKGNAQASHMKAAAERRIRSRGPSGGKNELSPQNNKGAGSMIPTPKKGMISTFVKENYKAKKR